MTAIWLSCASTRRCGGSSGKRTSAGCARCASSRSPITMNDSPRTDCPFCDIPADRVLAANEYAVAVLDAYPVSPGHCLVVARRHVAGFFDLDAREIAAMVELFGHVRGHIEATHA